MLSARQRKVADDRAAKVFQMLEAAANAGEKCPSNDVIANVIGVQSKSGPAGYLALLATAGLIKVERGNSSRVVTIVKTGKRTAGVITKPHRCEGPKASPTLVAMARTSAATDKTDLLEEIEIEASRYGEKMNDFLSRLLWLGLQCHIDDMLEEARAA